MSMAMGVYQWSVNLKLQSWTKLLEKTGLFAPKNRSRKPLAQQYYYSNFPLPLPLFNVEFRKPQFLGKRLGATNNIELGEGGGETRLLVFSQKETLELNFLNSFVQDCVRDLLGISFVAHEFEGLRS